MGLSLIPWRHFVNWCGIAEIVSHCVTLFQRDPDEGVQGLLTENSAESTDPAIRINVERRFQNIMVVFIQNDPQTHISIKPGSGALNPGNFQSKPASVWFLARDRQDKQIGSFVLANNGCDQRSRARFAAILRASFVLPTPEVFV